MKEFWDSRYAEGEYAYGTEPNRFLKKTLDMYGFEGSILFPAEGEGRNAVYAAQKGLKTVAFDISSEGQKKAKALAAHKGVEIDYQVGDFFQLPLLEQKYDVAAMVFAHFPLPIRSSYHQKIAELIKPEGYLILEAFSKNHVKHQQENPKAGGPQNPDMLFSEELILEDFKDFDPLWLEEKEVNLREGLYHIGKSSVIRFIGKKKA